MLCDARITKAQVAAVAGGADLTLRPGTAELLLLLQERGVRTLPRAGWVVGGQEFDIVSQANFQPLLLGKNTSVAKAAVPTVHGGC